MAQWHKILRSLGFTESEANLYLISVEIGPSSAQDLAKKGKFSRATAYLAIEALMRAGLMSTVQKGKKNLYVAESPERLRAIALARAKAMETTVREIEASVEDLKLLQRGEKPVVKLFEGHEALKAIQDDILETEPETLDEFGNLDEVTRAYNLEELNSYYQKANKLKTKVRAVFLSDDPKNIRIERANKILEVYPTKAFPCNGDVLVYDDKIALSTFRGKQISVLIESAELARTMRAFFDLSWKNRSKK